SQLSSVAEVSGNRVAEGAQAVVAQRQPQLQRAEAPRKFQRLFKKREPFDWIFTQGTRIFTGMTEGRAGILRIAKKQAAAVQRLVQPFMRVERYESARSRPANFAGIARAASAP